MIMRTEEQDKLYDRGYFERWLKSLSPSIKRFLKKEGDYLIEKIPPNSIILDVGCGFGRSMKTLAPRAKKVIGIDYNERMIREAKKKLRGFDNVELFFENAKNMHFRNNVFDSVICILNTFGDFGENKILILKEMKRVCRKDGKIIITVWSEKSLNDRIKTYEKAGWEIEEIEGNNIVIKDSHTSEAFTKEGLLKIFNGVGLKPKVIGIEKVAYLAEAKK